MRRTTVLIADDHAIVTDGLSRILKEANFDVVDAPLPEPKDGEALVRTRLISLDAANRAWMHGATYRSAVEANSVMAGGSISEVVSSKAPGLEPGDIVFGDTGWQDFAAVPAKHLSKMPRMEPMTHLLSVYGIAGLTAYFGLLDVGKPKAGETVVVSAAAGSVGSIVGQIAKIKGCRVVGIAGGKDKCDYVVKELGFDACVDYKAEAGNLFKAIREACPKGIDIYFENVGGAVQAAVVPQLNDFALVPLCGLISSYNEMQMNPGPDWRLLLIKRALVKGFIVSDHFTQMPEFWQEVPAAVKAGKIKYREDIVKGIENAPEAFMGLLKGKNFGKLLVQVSEDPTRP